jgi:hypothetical protein
MNGSPILFAIAALLPWIAGTQAASLLLRGPGPGPGHSALAIGFGYPLGMLIVILVVLAWHAAGLQLAPVPLLFTLGCLNVVMGLAMKYAQVRCVSAPPTVTSGRLGLLVSFVLVGFIVLRLGTLALELLSRPLFAWDAWMNWAPKAMVWFNEQRLTPFVSPQDWLEAPPDSGVFTLGNRQASEYPPGVPIIMLWHMLALGSSMSSWVFIPWILLPLSLALACWGTLRVMDASPVIAATGAYLLISTPFLNVHSALAGYADLWLAAYFGLGIIALYQWQTTRRSGFIVLLLLFAAGAILVKVPGLVFAALVLGLLLARLPGWSARAWCTLIGGAIALLLLALTVGITLPLLGGSMLAIRHDALTVPYLGTLELGMHPLGPILARTMLVAANWHLFWPALLLALVARGYREGVTLLADPIVQSLAIGAGLLCFVFGFTDYFKEAENLVTLNRTLLYLLLPGILLITKELDEWARHKRVAE